VMACTGCVILVVARPTIKSLPHLPNWRSWKSKCRSSPQVLFFFPLKKSNIYRVFVAFSLSFVVVFSSRKEKLIVLSVVLLYSRAYIFFFLC
jgi:hypothetical protein